MVQTGIQIKKINFKNKSINILVYVKILYYTSLEYILEKFWKIR